ncbi:hypothetical protein P171DRAFT_474258 [Karstenula rhodostoma CBS 690.94]|uniref:LysM domain-containing protein n=1 Tax=Karstenula rhodostoma CBS 690.94 TaxID=1392251 RepID=A0A9P4UBB3_9PLEO|nr:hypothetical protein P171DRAFT_474258 [Karstenula rhodostoma CBS 690.94]
MPRPKRAKVASTAARVAKPTKVAHLPAAQEQPKSRKPAVPKPVEVASEDSDGLVIRATRARRRAPLVESQEEVELTMTGALPVASERASSKNRTPESQARRTRKSMGSAQGSTSKRSPRATVLAQSQSARKETSHAASEEGDSSGFGDHLLSFTSLGSDSPAHGTRPPSAIKVGATPAHERSILALTNFKRRARQPSLLRMVHQTTDVEDSDHDNMDLYDLDDFHPNAESTPLPKAQNAAGKEGATDSGVNLSSSSSRGTKRKLSPVVQVPRSSPPYDPPSGPGIESRSPSPSLPDVVRSTVEEEDQDAEEDRAEQEIFSDTMAPPISSSDYPIEDVEEPQDSPVALKRTRHKPASAQKNNEESEGEETDRPRPSKGKKKTNREKGMSTAKLQAMLPKRRTRATHDDSDSASPIDSDEDELSMPPRRHARLAKKIAAPKAPKKSTRGTKKPTATTGKAPTGSRTYGRRISSDKENEGRAEAEEDDDESGNAAREMNGKPSSHLEAMAKKFADIDEFDLDFESRLTMGEADPVRHVQRSKQDSPRTFGSDSETRPSGLNSSRSHPVLCCSPRTCTARLYAMNPTNGSKSSSTPATSTLRPRTRRLISVEDGLNPPASRARAARSVSPARGARAPSYNAASAPTSSFERSGSQSLRVGRDAQKTLSGIWGNSWSAIQGLATNVLGNEAGAKDTLAATRKRKPVLGPHRRTSTSAPPKQWGPSASSTAHVGAGSHEERESMVRAMKRKDLLLADSHMSDSVGRLKRRNSDDRMSSSAPPGENEDRDALIYIHNVRPQDTLAGITIKFNCQPAVLRKANRMWPNDSVQTKKTIVLPVDACGVKGRPVAGPAAQQDDDLLLGDWSNNPKDSSNGLPNGWTSSRPRDSDTSSTFSPAVSNADSEPPWKHDSWVLLPSDKEPIEIGRMPRRELGFFPPARRKSLVFSDASTPRASVDMPRSSTSTSTHSPTTSISRPRASSTLSTISAPYQGRPRNTSGFHLHGPGGVGTMGKNVRSPGPGQDPLNKLFAAHLPNVEPPPDQEYFTPWAPGLLEADSGRAVHHGGSGTLTPSGGAGLDLQEIGGAIEGWVRKVGTQASKLLTEPSTPRQGKRSAVPVIGAVGGDLGDVIELRDDAFEIGCGGEDRGRTGRSDSRTPTNEQYQSARPDFNLVLRARGPKRGSSKND